MRQKILAVILSLVVAFGLTLQPVQLKAQADPISGTAALIAATAALITAVDNACDSNRGEGYMRCKGGECKPGKCISFRKGCSSDSDCEK